MDTFNHYLDMCVDTNEVFIVGDTHAEFGKLNKFISHHDYPKAVIVCGDFGWWPKFHASTGLFGGRKIFDQYSMRNRDTKVFWCDGNHEDHDDLQERIDIYGRVPIEIMPNVFFCPRGSTVRFGKRNFMFFGGATSIDKVNRIPGHTWFSGENITQKDIAELPDVDVDFVVSHAAPEYFKIDKWIDMFSDSNRKALNIVFDKYRPERWFFGHYHDYINGLYKSCRWRGLACIESDRTYCSKVFV